MKITKQELVNIIKEEVEKALGEQTALSYDEKVQQFNKLIGVKSRVDYLVKVIPTFKPGDPGTVAQKDYKKFFQAGELYDDSLYFYLDGQGIYAGILHSLGKKKPDSLKKREKEAEIKQKTINHFKENSEAFKEIIIGYISIIEFVKRQDKYNPMTGLSGVGPAFASDPANFSEIYPGICPVVKKLLKAINSEDYFAVFEIYAPLRSKFESMVSAGKVKKSAYSLSKSEIERVIDACS